MKKFISLLVALSFTTSCKTMSEKQDNSEVEAFIPLGNGLTRLTKTCAIISENRKAAAAAKSFYQIKHRATDNASHSFKFLRGAVGTHYPEDRGAYRNRFIENFTLINTLGFAQKSIRYINHWGRASKAKKIGFGHFRSRKNHPFQLITPELDVQNISQRKHRKKCRPKLTIKIEGLELNFGKGCSKINRNKNGSFFRFTYIYTNKRTGLQEANGILLNLPYADENSKVAIPALLCQREIRSLSFIVDSITRTKNSLVVAKGIKVSFLNFTRKQIFY